MVGDADELQIRFCNVSVTTHSKSIPPKVDIRVIFLRGGQQAEVWLVDIRVQLQLLIYSQKRRDHEESSKTNTLVRNNIKDRVDHEIEDELIVLIGEILYE